MIIKERLRSAKNHVVKHRAKYTFAAAAFLFMAINKRSAELTDEFLIDHNIDPRDYWTPDWESW